MNKLLIRQKFMLLLLILVVIPLSIALSYFLHQTNKKIRENNIQFTKNLLISIVNDYEEILNEMISQSNNILYDKRLQTFIKYNGQFSNVQDISFIKEFKSQLRFISLNTSSIQSIAIFNADSKKIINYNSNSSQLNIETQFPYQEVMNEHYKHNDSVMWWCITDNNSVDNIFFTKKIYNHEDYELAGFIVIALNKDYFNQLLLKYSNYNLKSLFILVDNQYVLTSIGEKTDSHILEQKTDKDWFIKNNQLVAYKNFISAPWSVVITTPDLANEPNWMWLKNYLIVLVFWIIIIFAIFVWFMRVNIFQPLNKLASVMTKFGKGNYDERVKIDRKDEIGYLNIKFNEMTDEIKKLHENIYLETITRKEAEIKGLQAQINPHFLFNTLESINWIARFNNVEEISKMVSDLSYMMAYTMNTDSKFILINKELEYLDCYICLLKVRYKERIVYIKTIDVDDDNLIIPKLIIQPLIENSIKYGVEKSKNVTLIQLKITKSKEKLIISVKDSGPGIDNHTLQDIQRYINYKGKLKPHKNEIIKKQGIGLRNISKRLQILYGEEQKFIIESQVHKYTKITMELPLQQKEGM